MNYSLSKLFVLLLIAQIGIASIPVISWIISNQNAQNLPSISVEPNWDYSTLESSAWITPQMRDGKFLFEVQSMNYAPFLQDIVNRSVQKYDLGEITPHWNSSELGEWDYSFLNLKNGAQDGSGRVWYGGFPTPPSNRSEALSDIMTAVLNVMANQTRPWASFNGHYPYQHYAGEMGFDAIGSEIGENIHNYQLQLAFNRGAARQYDKPWYVDVSAWYSGGITDYSTSKPWGAASGSNNGHSLSLYNRTYFMSYMAGTSCIIAEAGGVNFFIENKDADNCFTPSPLGLVGQGFYNFTQNHPDPGIPYTPFALLLDLYHGTSSGYGDQKAFDYFPYDSGDMMSYNLENMFFPNCWKVGTETYALTNSPYGDTCDVLLQDASQNVLDSYPVIIPSGDILFNTTQRQNLINYVDHGGILMLNKAYINQFPSNFTINSTQLSDLNPIAFQKYGKGTIIFYGPNYDVTQFGPKILNQLIGKVLPFTVQGNVEYQINRKASSWVLTIMNNNGVTKDPNSPAKIDPTQTQQVQITYTGSGNVSTILNWLNNQPLTNISKNTLNQPTLQVTINPGEFTVLEFQV